MTPEELKLQIDTDITNKTSAKSITPLNVGKNMKDVVDFIPDITNKENISNKSTNIITDATSDIKYPSVKSVKTQLDLKVDKVTSKSLVLDTEITKLSHLDDTTDLLKPLSNATIEALALKLASGGFAGTAEDLRVMIASVMAGVTIINGVTPTSAIPATGNIYTIVTTDGTYVNWNNLVVPVNSIAVLMRVDGVYSVSQTSFDITSKVNVSDVIDNLTSTETAKPLSAAQGKALNENKLDKTDLYINSNCFVPYGDLSTLDDAYSTTVRGKIYQAFKSLKLYGFDNTKPHKINVIWNDTYNPTNHFFRLGIESFDGSVWSDVFDTAAIEMSTLGFVNDKVVVFNQLIGEKRVIAEIDLALIPLNYNFVFNGSEMIFSEKCFINNDKLYTYGQDLGFDKNVKFNSIDSKTVSTKNDFFNDNFVRYNSDISYLDFVQVDGYTRKLKYQAIKNVELYGFDKTMPIKISHFWVDCYNPTNHFYRLILKQYTGSTWETVVDTTALEKSVLGIIDGKPFVWNYKSGIKRFSITIDFSNLAVNDNFDFNVGDPDLVFSQKCFKNEPMNVFNATKNYFTSMRKPTFAFIFDDLNLSDTLVFNIFREYGFLPSFAIQTSRLNSVNAEKYKDFYLNGCSILAHSVTHPVMSNSATITIEEVDSEMKNSKKTIEDYGMMVSGWVTPGSSLHVDFLPLIDKNFGYGFTGLNAGLYNHTLNPKKMNRYGLESEMAGHNSTSVRARIDTAITNNELLVFYGHELPSTYLNGDGTPYITEADLRYLLDYLKVKSDDNLCEVLSCDEAVTQYYKSPFA